MLKNIIIYNKMHIPNEILNIIFSYVERPKYAIIMKEIITQYDKFICVKPIIEPKFTEPKCNSPFHIYFFRLFLPIWSRWPENYPKLYSLGC
jgi:hypothetical protein